MSRGERAARREAREAHEARERNRLPARAARAYEAIIDTLNTGTLWLRVRAMRATLSIVGVAIGIATVVLVASLPASSQAALEERLTALGADVLRIDPVQTSTELQKLPTDSLPRLARVGPVRSVFVAANLHVDVQRNDRQRAADNALVAMAVAGDFSTVLRSQLLQGSWVEGVRPSVVLGSEAARRLGIPRLPSSATSIEIEGIPFTVVGILEPTELAVDMQSAVFMSWEAAHEWLEFDGQPTVAYVTAFEDSIREVRPVLAATIAPDKPGGVQVSQPSGVLAAKETSRTTFDGLFLALALVALTVGGIGIANTMFASILERRRDIGLRRALGARRLDISSQFLVEASALCAAGGVLGSLAGAGLSAVWAIGHDWPVVIPPVVVLGAIAASLATGVIAGLAPSVRAARLDPASALSLE